jgi:hypothetical protein
MSADGGLVINGCAINKHTAHHLQPSVAFTTQNGSTAVLGPWPIPYRLLPTSALPSVCKLLEIKRAISVGIGFFHHLVYLRFGCWKTKVSHDCRKFLLRDPAITV